MNCHVYLAELIKKKNKTSGASTLSIFVIELYAFPNKSWVYDTGCGTNICNTTQGLRGTKKLKHGALNLHVGNGNRVAVEAIGSFDLILPNGLCIVLDNCHYTPFITGGVISFSRLKTMNGLISQEVSGSYADLEEIQDEDTHPFENTSEHHDEVDHEIFEPQSDVILIPMNAEMQSIKDNEFWTLIDLPPNAKTIRSKWLFEKKTDMDVNVHTYKARLVAKGYTKPTGECHWIAVKNILKYLRNTKDMFLVYGDNLKGELRVTCYTDVGYETGAYDSKS
ncbi:retrotransposon protein, putative, ty1-copia subclass [Tanacetum coccineum]